MVRRLCATTYSSSEHYCRKTGVRSRKPGDGRRETGVGSWKTGVQSRKTEAGSSGFQLVIGRLFDLAYRRLTTFGPAFLFLPFTGLSLRLKHSDCFDRRKSGSQTTMRSDVLVVRALL